MYTVLAYKGTHRVHLTPFCAGTQALVLGQQVWTAIKPYLTVNFTIIVLARHHVSGIASFKKAQIPVLSQFWDYCKWTLHLKRLTAIIT